MTKIMEHVMCACGDLVDTVAVHVTDRCLCLDRVRGQRQHRGATLAANAGDVPGTPALRQDA